MWLFCLKHLNIWRNYLKCNFNQKGNLVLHQLFNSALFWTDTFHFRVQFRKVNSFSTNVSKLIFLELKTKNTSPSGSADLFLRTISLSKKGCQLLLPKTVCNKMICSKRCFNIMIKQTKVILRGNSCSPFCNFWARESKQRFRFNNELII